MEKEFDLTRKIYGKLVERNEDTNKLPLIVDGLRQVGKSCVVNKFAHENYENVITLDFGYNKEL